VIVADTHLVSYLLIEGERTSDVRRVHEKDPDWKVPTLWRSEFLSVLASAVNAAVLNRQQAFSTWWIAVDLFSGREIEPDGDRVLSLALDRKISAYDAHFVAVADELGVSLVTGDRAVTRQCPDIAVAIEKFAE
jgi:predicted nucleic acid-binding protein